MIPIAWREYLFRLRFKRLSRPTQRQLQASRSSLDETDLWQRIEAGLQSVPRTRIKKRSLHPGLRFSLAGLVLLPLLFLVRPDRTQSSYLKSVRDAPEGWPASTLGYALMDSNGLISRGDAGARIHPQAELALYVETPGLATGGDFRVTILVQHPDGRRENLLDDYRVAEEFEVLKGKAGIFIFRPEENGIYQFRGKRRIGSTLEDFPGFQVEFHP